MSTLLLRLAGPMQSWGTQSRFTVRDTGLEPSKSGVIGLLCAALGKPRAEQPGDGFPPLERLSGLKMGVRVDREGTMQVDYHTAGGTHRHDGYGVATFDGKARRTVQSHRYYLADADFLVGLESDDEELLHQLDNALQHPVWPVFLGRKAFVPGVPVRLPDAPPYGPSLQPGHLEAVLRSFPWLRDQQRRRDPEPERLRLVLETNPGPGAEVRHDVPLSFVSADRRFALRYVTTSFARKGEDFSIEEV